MSKITIRICDVCGHVTEVVSTEYTPESVAGIIASEFVYVNIGQNATLYYTVVGDDNSNKIVSFATSDPTVATIDSEGLITGLKTGTAVITVTTAEGGYTAECTVTVICPHDGLVKTEAKAATCTEPGNSAYWHCSVCDKYFSDAEAANEITLASTVIPATGHTPGESVVENRVEPNCTETGSYDEVVYCTVCHAELSKTAKAIPALGHDLVHHDAKAATCTEPGNSAYWHCSACDKYFSDAQGNTEITLESTVIPIHMAGENDPLIVVESKTVRAGNTVAVNISIKNNPGIASLKMKVAFGADLTLTEVVYNNDMGGNSQLPQKLTTPVTLNWYNGAANTNGDIIYATLFFAVSENAESGTDAAITVTYNPEDVYNIDEEDICFAVQNGNVHIIRYIPGDINDDGKVNNKDLTRLFQYLSDWEVEIH